MAWSVERGAWSVEREKGRTLGLRCIYLGLLGYASLTLYISTLYAPRSTLYALRSALMRRYHLCPRGLYGRLMSLLH